MELCPLWVHGRQLGQRLYFALWGRMSDFCFVKSEQGLFSWLALALKQEVYVYCHMQQLLPMNEDAPICSAVLDSLDPVYDERSGLVQWKGNFCLENFDVISVTGSVSYLIKIFSNPRPMPVDYLRHTQGSLISKYGSSTCTSEVDHRQFLDQLALDRGMVGLGCHNDDNLESNVF